jgi:uncharacterized protein (TIGR02284 family)
MAQTNDEVIDCLNDLIETCKDGQKGFREAAVRVGVDGEPELRTVLNVYAQQRAGFEAELQNEVLRRGGKPAASGHVSASFHRGWMDLKSAVTRSNESDILADCETGEKAALENYNDALKKNLPADLLDIVRTQQEEIRLAHERMRTLSREYKPAA